MGSTVKPNYLLWSLLFLSFLAHGIILSSVPDIFRFKREALEEAIEIELLVPEESPLRETPPPIPEIKPLQELKKMEKEWTSDTATGLVSASEVLQADQSASLPFSAPVAIPQLPYRPNRSLDEVPAPELPRAQAEKEAGSPETSAAAMEHYFEAVRTRIELNKKYPYSARRREVQGQVTVSFTIESDGTITGLLLKIGSGSAVLNKAALKAVEESVPFPQPPADLRSAPVYLEITIAFKMM